MKKFDPEPFESEMAELAPQSPQDIAEAWSERFARASAPCWGEPFVPLVEILMCCCCQEQLRTPSVFPRDRFWQMCDECRSKVMKSWRENLRQA